MTIQVRYQDGEIRAGFCIKQAALLFARKEPGIDKVSVGFTGGNIQYATIIGL
jgi:hypothetical protein